VKIPQAPAQRLTLFQRKRGEVNKKLKRTLIAAAAMLMATSIHAETDNFNRNGVEQQAQSIHYALGPEYGLMGSIGQALSGIAGRAAGILAWSGGLGGVFGGGSGAAPITTGTGADMALTPNFVSSAMASFNNPVWNQWNWSSGPWLPRFRKSGWTHDAKLANVAQR
jgi:hypothetical protein